VQDMANNLLVEHGGEPVGKHWVDNFKMRTPEIKLRRSRHRIVSEPSTKIHAL
jgi:hypothetical protein